MKKFLAIVFLLSICFVMVESCSNDDSPVQNSNIVAENVRQNEEAEAQTSTESEKKEEPKKEEAKLDFEAYSFDAKAFRSILNTPYFSCYFGLKNTGNVPFTAKQVYLDYDDNDGRLLGTDKYLVTIPEVILPGQVGYIYSYYYDLSGIKLDNGFRPDLHGGPVAVTNFYAIEISDISIKPDYGNSVKVTAKGTNNNGKDIPFAKPGAIFFDKDDKVIGFCYGLESFANGETKSFEISGDLMSSDIKPSEIDHVKVVCVGSY